MTSTTSTTATPPQPPQTVQVSGDNQITVNGVHMSLFDALQFVYVQNAEEMQGIAADRAGGAQDRLNDIKEARKMIAAAKQLKQDAGKKGTSTMPTEMKTWCDDNGVTLDTKGADNKHNKDQWEANIQYMQTKLDDMTSDNDLEMLKMKSAANKYSNGIQAAAKFLGENNQLMQGIIQKA